MQPPVLDQSISDQITVVSDALVVPPPKGDGNRSIQKSGALTPDGEIIENSITWRGQNQFNHIPDMPPADEIKHLSGRWMFAGPLFGHFGHFLVESSCRLWAVDQLRDQVDGILYTPKFQNRPAHVAATYKPLLAMMGVDMEVVNTEDPVRVDKLYVPQQGFGMFQMIEGAPEYREFMRRHGGVDVEPEGPENLYISRSELPPQRGGLLGEKILEEYLAQDGYEPFHPQKHDFRTQIARYKAARNIISIDGSPLHLVAVVGDPGQKVGVIARRAGNLDQIFARQLKAFRDIETTAVSLLERNWIPERDHKPSRVSFGEVDFAEIYRVFHAAGLIRTETPYPTLTDAQRTSLLADLEISQKTKFKLYEAAAA